MTDEEPQPLVPLLLTPEQAAEYLGLGRTTVYALMARGELECVAVGKRRRIARDAVHEYVNRLREQPLPRAIEMLHDPPRSSAPARRPKDCSCNTGASP